MLASLQDFVSAVTEAHVNKVVTMALMVNNYCTGNLSIRDDKHFDWVLISK